MTKTYRSPTRLTMTWDADALAHDLEFLQSRLYVARTLVPQGYESFFTDKARYTNADTSTAVEGNPLDPQQGMLILVEGSDASQPAQVEKTNLDEAYELIAQLSRDETVRIDQGVIRTMNSMILRNLPDMDAQYRGQYRLVPALVVDSGTKAVRYRPPNPDLVPQLMAGLVEDIQKWTDEKVDPAVISALVHFGLISIHPFRDGNGRTARLAADMVLYRSKTADYNMIAASQYFLDFRRAYYDLLRKVQGENFTETLEVTKFVKFHMEALKFAAIRLEEGAIELRKRIDAMTKNTEGVMNDRQTLGFMFMEDVAPLSTTTYAKLVKTSHSTAYADLADMTRRGFLLREGKGRNTRHRIHPGLRASEDDPEPTDKNVG